MHKDGYLFDFDCISKFHHSIFVRGWFHHPDDRLKSVRLICDDVISNVDHVGTQHGGVLNLGPDKGFDIQVLRTTADFDENAAIVFETEAGRTVTVLLLEATTEALMTGGTSQLSRKFKSMVKGKMLDIGGRARSGYDRSQDYPLCEVTVLDIVGGDNVDVVGDAHELSNLFPSNHFDAVMSVSVFEHLIMPWKAVLEMNRVLKPGGIGFIHTHQTLGMHDLPWDFWRFSDTSWKALFNKNTGFEIVDAAMDSPQFVVPFYFAMNKNHAESSAGFEGSAVLFRKIAESSEVWNTTLSQIDETAYPENDDEMSRQLKGAQDKGPDQASHEKAVLRKFLRF